MTKYTLDGGSSKYDANLRPSQAYSDESGYEPDVLKQSPLKKGKGKRTEHSRRPKEEKSSYEADILRNRSFKKSDSSEGEGSSERYRLEKVMSKGTRSHDDYINNVPGDFDDFRAHYTTPAYDQSDIQSAKKRSREVFGKPWDKLTPKDIRQKVDNLIRTSQSKNLSDGEIGRLTSEQYTADLAIFDKLKPNEYMYYYAQTDRITQNISQE